MASCLLHDSSCVRPKHSGCVPMRAYAECQNPTCAKVLAPERPFRLEHSKIMSNNVLWGSGAPKKNPANSPSCNHSRVLLKYLSVPSCTLPQPSVPSCRVLRRFNHRQSPPVSVLKWPITVLATLLYKSISDLRVQVLLPLTVRPMYLSDEASRRPPARAPASISRAGVSLVGRAKRHLKRRVRRLSR